MLNDITTLAYLDAGTGSAISVGLALVIGGGVGAAIGSTKGRAPLGFVLGALLFVLGWIIVAMIGRTRRTDTAAAVALRSSG